MTSRKSDSSLDNLLIDTWWYGLTARFSDQQFEEIARQRASEGFNAIQLVAGIPPEVSPGHPQAQSIVGLPWTLEGNINQEYLILTQHRIQILNKLGLKAIIYGSWGMQIEWMGSAFMQQWWRSLIKHLDHLDVIYCVTGEVNLWIEMPNILLPDRSTDDLQAKLGTTKNGFKHLMNRLIRKSLKVKSQILFPNAEKKRKHAWGKVLKDIAENSGRPVIVHTGGSKSLNSHNLIDHSELLAAITVQTGHSRSSQNLLWQLPLLLNKQHQKRFINLEPWYEGIHNDFYTKDQLFAYWSSMLAGSCSFAYGAHGLWNAGDGEFLAHWGKQTLYDALSSPTGGLLGKSHNWFIDRMGYRPSAQTHIKTDKEVLLEIRRSNGTEEIVFIPDTQKVSVKHEGEYFNPLSGEIIEQPPKTGPLVIFAKSTERQS